MVEEEYPISEEEQEEVMEDNIEKQAEIQQDVQSDVYDSASTYAPKDDLYSLFWKVVKTSDSSKVGNLDPKTELGMLNMSVRDCQRIALLAMTLKHPGFAKYFMQQAEIILATSASKRGWLPELFVSQRKFTTKAKETRGQISETQPREKKGFFARWKKTE